MSIENIENWYAYYPQNADWIGLSIYENGGNQGKDIAEMLERWYAIFQKQKPLMLSHVGISHYSEKNSKYTEKEGQTGPLFRFRKCRPSFPNGITKRLCQFGKRYFTYSNFFYTI